MPELPEVETVRIGLERLVINKTIQSVHIYWDKLIESPQVDEFKESIEEEKIIQIDRRGKFLIFRLTHFDLISHLRMEGKYEFHQKNDSLTKHTHLLFKFTDKTELRYLDSRKFGRFVLVPKNTANQYKGIKKLGPEPTDADFSLNVFSSALKKRKKAIKPLLLDQVIVTGLGNIYVDEVLFRAQIHPEKPANSLTAKKVKRLHQEIITVLSEAVKAGGTTIRTYQNALGDAGSFQQVLNVYGKEGQFCPRCQSIIVKKKVAQRGTHFCPNCQAY